MDSDGIYPVVAWPWEEIAETMNRLPMVEWDRTVRSRVEGGNPVHSLTVVYGWILRADGGRDYVQLEFASWYRERPGFTTSSAEHTAEMHRLLFSEQAADSHAPCVRVKDIPALAARVTRTVPW